jgi:excisionase family DNA binding protein
MAVAGPLIRVGKNMENTEQELRLITLEAAAAILQVSKRTLLRMIQKREVPAFKVGGQWRIRESQFRKWVEYKESAGSSQE